MHARRLLQLHAYPSGALRTVLRGVVFLFLFFLFTNRYPSGHPTCRRAKSCRSHGPNLRQLGNELICKRVSILYTHAVQKRMQ
jgi:hypothetical protein